MIEWLEKEHKFWTLLQVIRCHICLLVLLHIFVVLFSFIFQFLNHHIISFKCVSFISDIIKRKGIGFVPLCVNLTFLIFYPVHLQLDTFIFSMISFEPIIWNQTMNQFLTTTIHLLFYFSCISCLFFLTVLSSH